MFGSRIENRQVVKAQHNSVATTINGWSQFADELLNSRLRARCQSDQYLNGFLLASKFGELSKFSTSEVIGPQVTMTGF